MMVNREMTTREKEGFTLIELSLSIVFITVLSLAVALIIMNSVAAYHRGIILNQINTTGMELVDDMRAAVQNAQVLSIKSQCGIVFSGEQADECIADNGQDLVSVRTMGKVRIGNIDENDVPLSGAFCTGNYSYLWNSGYFYNSEDFDVYNAKRIVLKYTMAGDSESKPWENIRLLKVKDEKRAVCAAYSMAQNGNVDISSGDYLVTEEPKELLSTSSNLALFDLYAPTPAVNEGIHSIYYSVSFVLGTLQGGANVKAEGNYCSTPEASNNSEIENIDYCSRQ